MEKSQPKVRKRHRVRRWVVVGLVLVIGLIWALPYLASTGVGTGWIVAAVNGGIDQQIEIEELSLGWLGPCRVSGVKVWDAAGREIFRLDGATMAKGLLSARSYDFEELALDGPWATVYVSDEKEEEKDHTGGDGSSDENGAGMKLPSPKGRLIIRAGGLRMVQADGRSLDVAKVEGEFDLDTLNDIKGIIKLEMAGGGKIDGKIAVRQLVAASGLSLEKANGSFQVSTDGEVELGELLEFFGQQVTAAGKGKLDVKGTFEGGEVRAEVSTQVTGLHVEREGAVGVEPVDLSFEGNVRYGAGGGSGQGVLAGQAGNIRMSFAYRPSEKGAMVSRDDLVAAVLTGKAVDMPDFSIEAEGKIDLPVLAAAIPALLKVRSDVQITTGQLVIEAVSIRGGKTMAASGTVRLTNLGADREGKTIIFEPASVDFAVHIEPGEGLQISRAVMDSAFAKMSATGTPTKLSATFGVDLNKLHNRIDAFLDLPSFELGGSINGTADVDRSDKERVGVEVRITGKGILYRMNERELKVDDLDVEYKGVLLMSDQQRPVRLETTSASIDFDNALVVGGTGWYDVVDEALHGEVNVRVAELGYIGRQTFITGEADLSRYGGTMELDVVFDREAGKESITSRGEGVLREVSIDNVVLSKEEVTEVALEWSEMVFSPADRLIRVGAGEVSSEAVSLDIADIRLQLGEKFNLEGRVELSADLKRCSLLAGRIGKRETPPAIAGDLRWSGVCSSQGSNVTLVGKGGIEQLQIGRGDKRVSEPRLTFTLNVELDGKNEIITLKEAKLDSEILSVEITGTIEDYKSICTLGLTGEYEGSWERITALVHELAPEMKDKFLLAGVSRSEFAITGPARQMEMRPSWRDVEASVEVGWAEGEVFGMGLGESLLAATLKDGQILLADANIPVGEGRIRLEGFSVDLRGEEPMLVGSAEVMVLDNLEINRKMGKQLLSHINPIFADMTSIEGKVSLLVADVRLPLSEAIKRTGRGRGHLDLSGMEFRPRGLLAELMKLGSLNITGEQVMRTHGVDFVIEEGKITYDNFVLALSEDYDLVFRGSVGFDDKVDLVVSVPVTEVLLRKIGLGPLAKKYGHVLIGSRVDIPVRGTRLEPIMEWVKVDMKRLLDRAKEALFEEGIKGIFDKVLKREEPRRGEGEQEESEEAPERRLPGRKVIDDILDILVN